MKKKIIIFSIIASIVTVFVGFLLPYNYPSDIYNIFVMGYKDYANTWFLTSGRVICALSFYLFDFLNISINTAIIIMKILAITIASLSIYIFYDLIIKATKCNNYYQKLCIFIATLLVFLNNSSYQWFYYTESAIMWLGMLAVVIALKIYNSNSKYKYLKILICLLFSVNCYQATVLFYIPALILFLSLKKEKNIKHVFKELFINSILVVICLLIGYITVELIRKYNSFSPYIKLDFILNYKILIFTLLDIAVFSYSIFPNVINTFIILLTNIFLNVENKFNIKKVYPIIIIPLISLIEVLAITGGINFYIADRIIFAYVSSLGLIMIYLIVNSKRKILFSSIALLILMIHVVNGNLISIDSKKTRKMDAIYGEQINKLIIEYENKNDIKLKKIVYCFDEEPNRNYDNLIKTQEETCRGFFGDWILDNIFNYYSKDHNFTAQYNKKIHKTKFKSKNWDQFSKEQIIFENDTIYFCIY